MTSEPILSVAEVQDFLNREFPQVASDYLVESVGPMTARISNVPDERHLRPGGTISGPTLFSLADCAVYLAIIAHVGPEALAKPTAMLNQTQGRFPNAHQQPGPGRETLPGMSR